MLNVIPGPQARGSSAPEKWKWRKGTIFQKRMTSGSVKTKGGIENERNRENEG